MLYGTYIALGKTERVKGVERVQSGIWGHSFYMGWSGEASLKKRRFSTPEESKAVSLLVIGGHGVPGRENSQCKGPAGVAPLVCTTRVE